MKNTTKYVFLACVGATIYECMELCWRGYTHWSSALMGAIVFIYLGIQNEGEKWETPIWIQMIKGAAFTTLIEFITGVIVNVWLKENAWDYSNMWGNLLGQICPLFSFMIWPWVCLFGIVADDYIRYCFFKEDKPHYHLW